MVDIEIDIRVRVPIAGQELLDAQRSRAVCRADEHDISVAAGDQLEAAQNERAHQDLTELSVRLNDREQRVAIELDDFPWLADADLNEDWSAGEHGAFAAEHARSERDDELLDAVRRPDDLDAASDDDEHAHRRLAGLEQDFAARHLPKSSA